MALYTRLLVPIPLHKMAWLNGNIDTFWMLPTPSYLWSDAVLTAVYLINRMPSAPLNGGILLSRLYPDKPLFPLPPKIFGCVAFVHNHAPGLDKLAPRSIKGVFVGYSTTQKGYRVYIPASRRYIVSRDITFFEEQLFFESATSPPSPSPAMAEELAALDSRSTWELVPRPPSTSIVTCRWVFSVKHNPDGTVARYKARLV